MKYRVALCLAVALAAAAACSQPQSKGQYKFSIKEALARLENADIAGFRKHRQCGLLIHFYSSHPDDHSIQWDVTSDNNDVVNFMVALSPSGDGTKATIVIPGESGGGEMYDSKARYRHPGLRQPLRPALQELVDSAMEKRPFSIDRIEGDLSVDPVCNREFELLASGRPTHGIADEESTSLEDATRSRKNESTAPRVRRGSR